MIHIPAHGRTRDEVLATLESYRSHDLDRHDGKAFGYVSIAGEQAIRLAEEVHPAFLRLTALDPPLLPRLLPLAHAPVALRARAWSAERLGKPRTVALGLFGRAVCLASFGFVATIAAGLERTERFNPFGEEGTERVFGLSILVALTMLFAGPMGFAVASSVTCGK